MRARTGSCVELQLQSRQSAVAQTEPAGCWLLAVGCSLLAVWLLADWLLALSCSPAPSSRRTSHTISPITYHVACKQLPAALHSLRGTVTASW